MVVAAVICKRFFMVRRSIYDGSTEGGSGFNGLQGFLDTVEERD